MLHLLMGYVLGKGKYHRQIQTRIRIRFVSESPSGPAQVYHNLFSEKKKPFRKEKLKIFAENPGYVNYVLHRFTKDGNRLF